jgi:hypothetical protein
VTAELDGDRFVDVSIDMEIDIGIDLGIEIDIMTAEGYLDRLTSSLGMTTLTGRCSHQASSVCMIMIWTGLA